MTTSLVVGDMVDVGVEHLNTMSRFLGMCTRVHLKLWNPGESHHSVLSHHHVEFQVEVGELPRCITCKVCNLRKSDFVHNVEHNDAQVQY